MCVNNSVQAPTIIEQSSGTPIPSQQSDATPERKTRLFNTTQEDAVV